MGPLASLARLLESSYAATTVPTVSDARSALTALAPHFVVSAAVLPDGDGLSLVEAAKHPSLPHQPPVVVLSPTDSEPFLEAASVALAAVAWFRAPHVALEDEDELHARVVAAAHGRLGDPAFGAGQLAEAVGLSPRQLRRRLVALAGESPGDLLRRLRLERAADLLASGARVKEAGYAAGFGGRSTFRAAFQRHFGVSPSGYARPAEAHGLEDDASENGRTTSGSERISDDTPYD